MSHNDAPKRAAIFFDRDGVLNVDKSYVFKESDFVWIDGAREALSLASSKGFLSIVVTNQSGIARGFYSVEEMCRLHDWMKNDALCAGAKIDDFYFCPFYQTGNLSAYVAQNHPDRKPNPGMILRAAHDHNIDLNSSLLIGDKPSDIEAAKRAGVDSILFQGGNLCMVLGNWFKSRCF